MDEMCMLCRMGHMWVVSLIYVQASFAPVKKNGTCDLSLSNQITHRTQVPALSRLSAISTCMRSAREAG